ncbi:MAG: hypothetical protein ABI661_04900, partial [Gammaproteobacteria bacterium]
MSAPAGPDGLAPKTVFAKAEVYRIEALVDDSGIVEVLQPLLPSGGRRGDLSLRTILVGMGLAAAGNAALYLSRVHQVLLALPVQTRRRLGVTWTDARGREQHLTMRRVETLFKNLSKLVDGSEHFAGADLDEDQRAVRAERLELVTALLLSASLPLGWTSPGHVAVDATFIDANSRPEHTLRRRQIAKAAEKAVKAGRAADVASLLADDSELARALGIPNFGEDPDLDSARLKRLRKASRRAADRDAATIVYKGALRHAYAAHLAVSIPSEAHVAARLAHEDDKRRGAKAGRPVRVPKPEPEPHLILGLALTASTAPAAKACVDLTRRLVQGPDTMAAAVDPAVVPAVPLLPAGDLLTDRGYSESLPGSFHHPLRALGRRLIFDLHKSRRGVTGTHRGAILAFGNLYSPGINDYPDLLSLDAPSPFAAWEEWQRYFNDATLRGAFRLHAKGLLDADGFVLLRCPALGGKLAGRATLGCPVRGTVALVGLKGLLEVFTPPGAPRPDVCTQSSLTIPADVVARCMDLEWGSRAWYDSFVRRRPRVEGANGILKNPTFAALAHMNIRVRGRAKSACSPRSPPPSPTCAPATAGAPRSRRSESSTRPSRRTPRSAHRVACARPRRRGRPRNGPRRRPAPGPRSQARTTPGPDRRATTTSSSPGASACATTAETAPEHHARG